MTALFDQGPGVCSEDRGGFFWPSGVIVLGLIGLSVAVALLNQPELTGDPVFYRDRMEALFSGDLPYFDFDFEHFPLSALPMIVAWVFGGFVGTGVYTTVFAVLMGGCLLATTGAVCRIESAAGLEGATVRWMAMAGLLFPIVLFRSDPFVVLLAVAALHSIARGQEKRAYYYQLAGVLAKGWPALYAIPDWGRGHRSRALNLAGLTLVLVGLLLWVPGFTQARTFTGLHSETAVGSLLIAIRTAGGQPLELLYEAGATYVAVPGWALLLHANIAILVGLVAFSRFRRVSRLGDIPQVMGASILVLLLASPLLSPQFLLWFVPFVVFFRSRQVFGWGVSVTGLTLVYMLGWNSDFVGNPWWIYVLNARNVALIVLALLCAWELGGPGDGRSVQEADPRKISDPR